MTKLPFIYAAGLAVFMLGAASCAAGAEPEAAATAQSGAELTFVKSYQGLSLGVAAVQKYALAPDEACDNLKLGASFTWTSKGKAVVTTPGDVLTYIFAMTQYLHTSSVSMINGSPSANVTDDVCREAVSFTPEAGHAYTVKQITTFRVAGCAVEITDTSTGAVVADMQPAAALAICGTKPEKGKKD